MADYMQRLVARLTQPDGPSRLEPVTPASFVTGDDPFEVNAAAEAMETPVTKENTVLPKTVAIANRAGIFFSPRFMAT